jgi:5-amino-6-(5-phosphoribosylamino)uracil reductase
VTPLRLLLPGTAVVGDLTLDRPGAVQALADLYAYPTPVPPVGWVRACMVSSVDGSASGPDGRSGSISSTADQTVFGVLRNLADVVLVGAGTVRAEGYGPPDVREDFQERRLGAGQSPAPVLAVVTRNGELGERQADLVADAATLVVTTADADLGTLRGRFGPHRVLVAGAEELHPELVTDQLAARGLRRVLVEGGPGLLGRMIAAGRLDELCLTTSPLAVAGGGPRIAQGPGGKQRLRLAHLVECESSLFGRWLVQR